MASRPSECCARSRVQRRLQAWLFDPNQLAQTYPKRHQAALRFNAYYPGDIPRSTARTTSEVTGMVNQGHLDLAALNALPQGADRGWSA
jgi:hypothetical protein